jgi:hypothetical protein
VTVPTDTPGFDSPHWLEYLEPLAQRMSATGLARLASAIVAASLLAVALAIGIALRTAALGSVPAGFNQDEACNGYDAYSLLHTGRDQHGNLLPVAIQAFNDYRMPLFDYSLIVPTGLFGLQPGTVRLGAALWGIADLLGVAVLAVLIVGLRGAALAVALMALSPWHLPISRFGHEAITAASTTTLAAAALFIAMRLRRGKWLLVSGLLFGMSLYSYSITKAFVLPFLIWTAAVYWRELKPLRRGALAGPIIIVLCALPQAHALWRHHAAMMARYHTVSVLDLPWPLLWRALVHGYLFNFTPGFLFLRGSIDVSLHPPGYGQLLVAQAAMLFLAVCALSDARFRRTAIFLFGWLAIAGLTAALILPEGHPLHSLLMVTPFTLLSALGMVFLFDLAGVSRLARIVVASAIVLMMVIQGARFVSFYFHKYPPLAAYVFQYGLGTAVERAARLGGGPMVVTTNTNQPYIYVLFFTRYPPERFQNEPVVQGKGLFVTVRSFDRYLFEDPQIAYRSLPHGVFVLTGWEVAPAPPVFTIRSPAGPVAYQVLVK